MNRKIGTHSWISRIAGVVCFAVLISANGVAIRGRRLRQPRMPGSQPLQWTEPSAGHSSIIPN